ncbi:MAG: TolC family protein [Desulfovermiculus sp.]
MFILSVFILISFGSEVWAEETRLLDLRLGVHAGASRVVFVCQGSRPKSTGPLSDCTYPVSFKKLVVPKNWEASQIPHGSFFTQIEPPQGESGHTFVLHTSRKDLWVEEVVLKEDEQPGQYRLILDFWPRDCNDAPSLENVSDWPASRSEQDRSTKPEVISSLDQGERRQVRTDIVLDVSSQDEDKALESERQTTISGFRVGEHPDYTRVVIEAWGQEPQALPEVRNNAVRVDFESIDLLVPEAVLEKKLKGLVQQVRVADKSIHFELQPGTHKEQALILDTDPPRPGAYRLVLDLAKDSGPQKQAAGDASRAPEKSGNKQEAKNTRPQRSAAERPENTKQKSTVRTVRIGSILAGAGPELKEVLARARTETRELLGQDWRLDFVCPQDWVLDGDLAGTEAVLASAVQDPDLDMLWIFGPLAVLAASRLNLQYSFPVMGMTLWDVRDLGVNSQPGQNESEKSLVLVSQHKRILRDLEHMQNLFAPERVRILVPSGVLRSVPQMQKKLEQGGRELNIDISVTGVSDFDSPISIAQKCRESIPVYVGPGLGLSPSQLKELFTHLGKRHILTFSAAGHRDVTIGALAGARPELAVQLSRRIALNTRDLLTGGKADTLSTTLNVVDRLKINARTARDVGWNIGLETSLQAGILHAGAPDDLDGRDLPRPELSIEQAMRLAAQAHPGVDRMEAEADSARARSGQAAGGLWPQIEARARSRRIDADRAEASLGLVPESRTSGAVSLQQMIFDDSVISDYRSSRHSARRQDLLAEAERLDVMHQAGRHYYALLQARAMYRIEQQNLETVRHNLHLAKVRRKAGHSGPEDVLRWETRETRQLERVLQAGSDLDTAWVALNQAMGQAQSRRWSVPEETGRDVKDSVVHQGLALRLRPAPSPGLIADYAVKTALKCSPELAALEEYLHSAQIQARKKQRSLYVPSIGLALEYAHIFDEHRPEVGFSGAGQPEEYAPIFEGIESEMQSISDQRERQEWSAAVEISLPLFQGGRRLYEIQEAQAGIRSLRSRLHGSRQLIEQRVRSAVHALSSSLPGVDLSRKAREQAREHMDIIQDRYARGRASVLEILDAQNEWHVQEQRYALARYTYARDLLDLQRAMAWMEWTKTDGEKSEWLEGLREAVEDTG